MPRAVELFRPARECGPPFAALPISECLAMDIGCEGLPELTVYVKVSEPRGPAIGTVVFGTGGPGTGMYETFGPVAVEHILRPLLERGYRVVQRAWHYPEGWLQGPGGLLRLGCRPAALYRALHERFQGRGAFCVSGNSGGAGEIAYALAHYGVDEFVDLAVVTAGPPFGRLDLGCLPESDRSWPATCARLSTCAEGPSCGYLGFALPIIDSGYGGAGQCSAHDPGMRETLLRDSVLNGRARLDYPRTQVSFVFGGKDCSEAVPLGRLYAEAITSAKKTTIVPSAGHTVPQDPAGADQILADLVEGCTPRH